MYEEVDEQEVEVHKIRYETSFSRKNVYSAYKYVLR